LTADRHHARRVRLRRLEPLDRPARHPVHPSDERLISDTDGRAHSRVRIVSDTIASIITTALGIDEIPEIAITSTTALGVTHRFTNMTAFADEIANARIWSGFHYRFSTRVGRDMGLKIGEYLVTNVMHPADVAWCHEWTSAIIRLRHQRELQLPIIFVVFRITVAKNLLHGSGGHS
jgi:hypothetical protein